MTGSRPTALHWRPVAEVVTGGGPGTADGAPGALVAAPVAAALAGWPPASAVEVAPIDPALSDTAAFCQTYGVELAESANCVVITGKREGVPRYAACVILASTRADVNGVARRLLDVRKASFAPMDEAVELTGMEYGGITPIGLPQEWPVYVAGQVAAAGPVIIGAGVRGAKLRIDGAVLQQLPTASLVEDLAR